MRDDFSQATKTLLANRVGWKCSNPRCRRPTRGPGTKTSNIINIGVASHITAASEGGPRYDKSMSADERKSYENGIWLCQCCSKVIDSDIDRYTVEVLKQWKENSEQLSRLELEVTTEIESRDIDSEVSFLIMDTLSEKVYCDNEIEQMLIHASNIVRSSDNLDEALQIAKDALKKAEQNTNFNMKYSIAHAQKTVAQIMLALHKDLDKSLELIDQSIKNIYFNCKTDKLCGALVVKSGIALALGNIKLAWGTILAAEKISIDESTENQIKYLKALIMLERGEAFDARNLLQDCIDYYSLRIATCINEENMLFLKVQYAKTLNCMGYLLTQVGNYFDALEFYKSAIDELQNTQHLSIIVLFSLNYAKCLFDLGENKYVEQCLKFLMNIEVDINIITLKYIKQRFYELRSMVYYYFDAITKSEKDIELAIEYTEDMREKIYYHQLLANYVIYDCNSNKMLLHLREAEKIASSLEDEILLFGINKQRENIEKYVNYKFIEEQDSTTLLTKIPSEEEFKGIININEIERLNSKEEKEEAMSKALRKLIQNTKNKEKGDVSQNLINMLIKKAEKEHSPIEKAMLYNKIGHEYCKLGNFVKGKYWQELSYDKVKNTHNIPIKAFALMGLADIALLTHRKHDEEKARKYIDEVETIICGKPYWEIYARCEMFRARFEGRNCNYVDALKYIEEAQKIIEEHKLQLDDNFNYTLNCCLSFIQNKLTKVVCHEDELKELNEERLCLERWYPKYKKQLRRYWWYYRGMDVVRNIKYSKKSVGIIAVENDNAIGFFGELLSTLFSISSYAVKSDLSEVDNFSLYTLPVPENTPFPFSVFWVKEEGNDKYAYNPNIDRTDKTYPYVMIESKEIFDKNLEPKPLVLEYAGIDIPNVVYSTPIVTEWKEKSGLWWLPSNFGNDDGFIPKVLNYAKDLKAIPLLDYKNVELCSKVEIINTRRILIPYYDPLLHKCESVRVEQVRSIIKRLTEATSIIEMKLGFDELSNELEKLTAIIEGGTFVDIAILSFPFDIWIDGYSEKTYYPALLISDSVLVDKETYGLVATKISTIAEIYNEL